MFTGIIEEVGVIEAVGSPLRVSCAKVLSDASPGGSIAVNGVCLTVVDLSAQHFAADVSPETLRASNLGDLREGDLVNLERPLLPSSRLGGHFVQGHVDGTGELLALEPLGGEDWWLKVRFPAELARYLVYKGSVAIDGISLTIAAIEQDVFSVAVIPHTYQNTALRSRRRGDRVNLECDILAKYVARLLESLELRPAFPTVEQLREMGY